MKTPATFTLMASMAVVAMLQFSTETLAQTESAEANPLDNAKVFKDWTLACEKPPGPEGQKAKEQCYIFQHVSVKESKKTLLRVAIGYVGKDPKPAAVVTVPLGIFLPPGFVLSVDKSKGAKFPVQFCNPAGCRGILPLDNAMIAQMKRGQKGQIGFFDGGRREIGIPISLLGFTAGFDSLRP